MQGILPRCKKKTLYLFSAEEKHFPFSSTISSLPLFVVFGHEWFHPLVLICRSCSQEAGNVWGWLGKMTVMFLYSLSYRFFFFILLIFLSLFFFIFLIFFFIRLIFLMLSMNYVFSFSLLFLILPPFFFSFSHLFFLYFLTIFLFLSSSFHISLSFTFHLSFFLFNVVDELPTTPHWDLCQYVHTLPREVDIWLTHMCLRHSCVGKNHMTDIYTSIPERIYISYMKVRSTYTPRLTKTESLKSNEL